MSAGPGSGIDKMGLTRQTCLTCQTCPSCATCNLNEPGRQFRHSLAQVVELERLGEKRFCAHSSSPFRILDVRVLRQGRDDDDRNGLEPAV